MSDDVKRREWTAWAKREFGGPPDAIQSVAQAALVEVKKGSDTESVVRAGKAALPNLAPGYVRGRVSGFSQRFEAPKPGTQIMIWNLRVEGLDDLLNDTVSLEMRGSRFTGSISNGDIIAVNIDQFGNPGLTTSVPYLFNLSSNALVGPSIEVDSALMVSPDETRSETRWSYGKQGQQPADKRRLRYGSVILLVLSYLFYLTAVAAVLFAIATHRIYPLTPFLAVGGLGLGTAMRRWRRAMGA